MGSRWLEGVVAGCHDGTHKVFFVQTWDGIAVVYPRIHNRDPSVRVGAYVRVRVSPAPKMTLNMEVEELSVIDRPVDHEVNVMGEEIEFIFKKKTNCDFPSWFIFKNDFLGRLSMRNDGGNLEKNLRIGCKYRVICGRARNGSPMLQEKTFWTISDIRLAEQVTDTVSWYEGVVTRTSDFISITSFELSIDVVLRARFCSREGRESLLGQWIRFRLQERRRSDRGIMYVAEGDYVEIDPVVHTRMRLGQVEVRVVCRFSGEMEGGRPLLQSTIGPIRDHEGIIDMREGEGEYEFWMIKYYKQNHTARWKLSFLEGNPKKIDWTKSKDKEK
ncbi:hypothetical protein PFISCL1PPCAC_16267, partial [Pristionchus fissidentatus]